jgi:ParB family transcriptional regulator, chromosome partitioning protein
VSDKRPRLGRGLEALIPKTFMTSGKTLLNISLAEIRPNPFQPRLEFDEESIDQLAVSVKRYGVAQPILVRKKSDYYELIAGERRYRACLKAGLSAIPAIVKDVSDMGSLQLALIENLEREDLNPIEEAKGYDRLIKEFGMTHQLISESLGKSRSAITNTLRLLKLPSEVQDAVSSGAVSGGHARSLITLGSDQLIIDQMNKIIQGGLNVREAEKAVSESVSSVKPKAAKGKKQGVVQLALFQDMEKTLSEKYDANIHIKGTRSSGSILINYSSESELKDIYKKLSLV